MKEKITTILIEKLKEYHANFTVPYYDDEIIEITVFHPVELDYDNLNNICGQAAFMCNVKSNIKGVAFRNRTYSFKFSGIEAIMEGNQITDLDTENMVTSQYNREA